LAVEKSYARTDPFDPTILSKVELGLLAEVFQPRVSEENDVC